MRSRRTTRLGTTEAAEYIKKGGLWKALIESGTKWTQRREMIVHTYCLQKKAKRDRKAKGMAVYSSDFKDGVMPYSEYRVNGFCPKKEEEEEDMGEEKEILSGGPKSTKDITKPLPYLAKMECAFLLAS